MNPTPNAIPETERMACLRQQMATASHTGYYEPLVPKMEQLIEEIEELRRQIKEMKEIA